MGLSIGTSKLEARLFDPILSESSFNRVELDPGLNFLKSGLL